MANSRQPPQRLWKATDPMAEYTVTNPATNTVVCSVATATDAEVDAAVSRAGAAYRTWRRIAITERAAYLAAVGKASKGA